MNLGENIYRLRTEKNLSQGDLADALEVSRQSVSKWENNSAVPELEKLIKMAQIFGITIDELVTGSTPEEKQAEQSAQTPPVQSPPPPAPQARSALTAHQVLGIVLAIFGGISLIVFTVVGIFIGFWLLGLIISLPFILCGVICILCKKNVGLKCAWAIYIPFWLFCMIMMTR